MEIQVSNCSFCLFPLQPGATGRLLLLMKMEYEYCDLTHHSQSKRGKLPLSCETAHWQCCLLAFDLASHFLLPEENL